MPRSANVAGGSVRHDHMFEYLTKSNVLKPKANMFGSVREA